MLDLLRIAKEKSVIHPGQRNGIGKRCRQLVTLDYLVLENHHLHMTADKNAGHLLATDPSAKSASDNLPAFIVRPSDAPVYHGFQILDDVVVDGFTLGIITSFEEDGATEGDAFIIAPDKSRAGLVWSIPDGPENEPKLDQLCPMEKTRWGVWELFFPFRMANCDDARRNLQAVLPMLKPKWEEWRRTFSVG